MAGWAGCILKVLFSRLMLLLGSVVKQAGGGRQPVSLASSSLSEREPLGQKGWDSQKPNVYLLPATGPHPGSLWDGGNAGPRPVNTNPVCKLKASGHHQGGT